MTTKVMLNKKKKHDQRNKSSFVYLAQVFVSICRILIPQRQFSKSHNPPRDNSLEAVERCFAWAL